MLRLILFFCILSITSVYSQDYEFIEEFDSIYYYRAESKNKNLILSDRISFAKKAIRLSKKIKKDTTLLKSKRSLSSIYLVENDYEFLKLINYEIKGLAEKVQDSASIANANFILGHAHKELFKTDSAYYYYFQAAKIFDAIDEHYRTIDMLYNMADIQSSERDYVGSEIKAIEAIKKLKVLPESEWSLDYLWSMHNLIGIGYGEMKEYDKAISEYETALSYIRKLDNNYYYKLYSNNNIASIYRKKGEYKTAVEKFSSILNDKNLKTNDSFSYASVLGNLAYSKFLNGQTKYFEIQNKFHEALKISNDLKNESIIMSNSTFYSEFLKGIEKKDSALYYANLAYGLARKTNSNNYALQLLIIKSELVKDSSSYFLNKHIKLNDSLINAERSIRNKFTRIDYDTETFKQESEMFSRQNLWLIVGSSILAFMLLLVYVIKTRREKRKELELVQQQQQANEEIYNLMLAQQDKMDEARAIEKKRISQEIHDGILGRLFGVRLNLDSLNFVKTDDAVTSRSNYINQLKEIEFDIRKVSHDLNTDFVSNSSFAEIINTLVETQCEAYGLDYKTTIDKDLNWEGISNKTKVHVYRITQETLQNIYKHAEASLVTLGLKQDNNLLSLSISDDGKGYDNSKKKDGIGIKNIKSRVDEIKGELTIETAKNQGTKIKVIAPI